MTTIGAKALPDLAVPGPRRVLLLRIFLWASAVSWGTGFGAKLFDLVVLASAWGAAPPRSLSLMPYGRLFPINPGDFFQPLSAALLIASVGALGAGWQTQRQYRFWLFLPVVMLAVIWVLTPTIFWPLISDLWAMSKGTSPVSSSQALALTQQWFVWDSLRTALIGIGFAGALQAKSTGPRRNI